MCRPFAGAAYVSRGTASRAKRWRSWSPWSSGRRWWRNAWRGSRISKTGSSIWTVFSQQSQLRLLPATCPRSTSMSPVWRRGAFRHVARRDFSPPISPRDYGSSLRAILLNDTLAPSGDQEALDRILDVQRRRDSEMELRHGQREEARDSPRRWARGKLTWGQRPRESRVFQDDAVPFLLNSQWVYARGNVHIRTRSRSTERDRERESLLGTERV
jgi:hypothetical protein